MLIKSRYNQFLKATGTAQSNHWA